MNEERDFIKEFVIESNKIEGIIREPRQEEIDELKRFMALPEITVRELQNFVSIYQPNAVLRDKKGLNVRVGNYYPPKGAPEIYNLLAEVIKFSKDAYEMHIAYEKLHPFTDCNGRSGRALWAWKHRNLSLGFLHMFYYQTLSNS